MKTIVKRFLAFLISRLPARKFLSFLQFAIESRASESSPADGLRLLLTLDNKLYSLQGRLSVAYDHGIHTKHRHTKYHDFFVARISADCHVLDIGCGTGSLAFDIATRSNARVSAVDISQESISIARERFHHPGLEFFVADASKNLPGGSYDVIVLSNFLEHLTHRPEFLKRVIDVTGARRTLIRVPLFERDWRVPLKQELALEWRCDPTHETEYTLESFALEMQQADLAVSHLEVRWGEIWCECLPIQHGF
ncbi:MAG: class I SAM-dependent methyltransferase [Rhodospirillales bacterium]|nr:class I SAM-dependent methyltransferase [Rhodospirillales bacterium]